MIWGVILAGGRGERFWPLSRSVRAKQFLPLLGDKTLLAATVERIAPLVPPQRLLVVTGADQAAEAAKALPDLPAEQVLAEPGGRNTAPAVALGAAWALERDPDPVLLVVPSDAWVGDEAAYRAALTVALSAAAAETAFVTLGVVPTRPETGYGYLETGAARGAGGLFEVRRFVEKPDGATAAQYLTGGRHLWNCGIFVMRAAVLTAALERHLPGVAGPLGDLRRAGGPTDAAARSAYYAAVPSVSIDYGVMEKADNVLTVRGAFPWDDLGSWLALERVLPPDDSGSVTHGEVLALDCEGDVLYSGEGLLAVLGVSDLVVVRAGDVTLVVPKARAQEVRRLVQALAGREEWRRYQ